LSSDILNEVIWSRHSVRKYTDEPVDDEKIEKILKSACAAPSAHNTQPWRFFILKEKDLKYRFARAMADLFEQDLISDGVTQGERDKIINQSIKKFTGAPVLIVVCMTLKNFPLYPDRRRQEVEKVLCIQSVSAAIQNMLLTASSENLGACWRCAPAYAGECIKNEFSLPHDIEPLAVITVGHPAENLTPKGRRPLEDLIIDVK